MATPPPKRRRAAATHFVLHAEYISQADGAVLEEVTKDLTAQCPSFFEREPGPLMLPGSTDEEAEDRLDDLETHLRRAVGNVAPVSFKDLQRIVPDTMTLPRLDKLSCSIIGLIVRDPDAWRPVPLGKHFGLCLKFDFCTRELAAYKAWLLGPAPPAVTQWETNLCITKLRLVQGDGGGSVSKWLRTLSAWCGHGYAQEFYGHRVLTKKRRQAQQRQAEELAAFIKGLRPPADTASLIIDSFHVVQQRRAGLGSKQLVGIPWQDIHAFSCVNYSGYLSGDSDAPMIRLRVPADFPIIMAPGGEPHSLITVLHGSTFTEERPEPWTGKCLRCSGTAFPPDNWWQRSCRRLRAPEEARTSAMKSGNLWDAGVIAVCGNCGYAHGCRTLRFALL